jgi:hypothetical protein
MTVTATVRRAAFPAAAILMTCAVTAVVLRFGTTPFRRYGAVAFILLGTLALVRAREATRVGLYCGYLVLVPALNVVREIGAFHAGYFVLTPAAALLAAALVLGVGHAVTTGKAQWRAPLVLMALVVVSGLLATGLAVTLPARPSGLATSLWLDGVVLPALLFAGIVTARPERRDLLMLAKAVVLAALFAIVLGLILNAAGSDLNRVVDAEADPLVRVGLLRTHATFTFGNPDQYALIGSLAVPIALMLAVMARGRERVLWAVATVAILVADVFTFSRGGMLGVVVGLLVIALYDRQGRRVVAVLAAAVVLLAVVTPRIGTLLTSRFTQADVLLSAPVQDRSQAVGLAVRSVQDRPLGYGGAAFRDLWRDAGYSEPALQSPHNLVLGVAVEYGLLAGIAFVGWLVACGRRVRRGLRRTEQPDPLLLGLAAGAAAFVVTGTLTGADLSHLAGQVPLATQTALFFAVVAAAVCLAARPGEGG